MDDLNKIVTMIGKTKGIHYRPHREDPKKYIVVKIYLKIGSLKEDETRKLLEDYLASLSIPIHGKLIRGSIKWIAIVDRDKFAAKHKGKAEGQVSGKQMADALNKGVAKEKASQAQQQKKWSLDDVPNEVSVKAGKYSLDMPSTVQSKGYVKNYSLDMSELPIGDIVQEARSIVEAAKSKPWEKNDDDSYTYKGKKGKWRTPKGDPTERLFIPDDGSEVMGVSLGKKDAQSGRKSLFSKTKKAKAPSKSEFNDLDMANLHKWGTDAHPDPEGKPKGKKDTKINARYEKRIAKSISASEAQLKRFKPGSKPHKELSAALEKLKKEQSKLKNESLEWLEDYGSKLDMRHINRAALGIFSTETRKEAIAYALAHDAIEREAVEATDGDRSFFVVGRLVDNGQWDLLSRMGEWIRVEFRGFHEPPSGVRW